MITAVNAAEPASVPVFAPAKLNLFLHVLGRRPDGYHDLESLFVFLDVGDRLHFEPADSAAADLVLDPDPGIPRAQNLIWRALERVRALEPRLPQPRIRVEKALPMQAGLGAAAPMRLRSCTGLKACSPVWIFAARSPVSAPTCPPPWTSTRGSGAGRVMCRVTS